MEQNLANSYRPQRFADVVGQPAAVSTLKRISSAEGIAVRAVFMKGAFGSGKCVHPCTVVKTSGGLRRAGEIVGGESFSVCGKPNGFVAAAENAVTKVYVIRTVRGKEFRVTGNHPVLVWDPYRLEYRFVEAADLKVNMTVLEDCSPVVNSLDGFDSWYYILGVLSMQGSFLLSDNSNITFATADKHLFDVVCGYCTDHYVCYYTGTYKKGGKVFYRMYVSRQSNLHLWMQAHGLIGQRMQERALPRNFYSWSFVQQVSFVRGIFDVGACYSGRTSFYVTHLSRTFLDGIQGVLSAMGYVTKLGLVSRKSYASRVSHTFTHRVYVYSLSESGTLPSLFHAQDGLASNPVRSVGGVRGMHFDGMGIVLRRKLKELGVGIQQVSAAAHFFHQRSSLSLSQCLDVEAYMRSLGYSDFQLVYPNTAPDVIERISIDSCPYTIDLQCSGEPVFSTDGIITHNTTLSRILAKSMNCDRFRAVGDVCNECAGCQEASAANSSLYWELDGTVVGNVEGIRNLKERLSVVPDGRRVVVLDEVQAISQAAADALLKVVEEGVPNTLFVFCGTEDIRPALRSRCVNIDISVIPLPLVEEHIGRIAEGRGLKITPEELRILAMKSQGHMRDALQLLQFYELAGPVALDSSYFKLRDFVAACFVKGGQPLGLLSELLLYSTADIRTSVGVLLRSIYTAAEGSLEHKMQKAGLGRQLFGFFFSPVAQQAMGSEVGMEVLLRSLVEKTAGSR